MAGTPLDHLARAVGAGRPHRHVWRGDTSAHIEVRGLDRADAWPLARAIEEALSDHPAVRAAGALPLLGRVMVDLRDGSVETSELVERIERVESDHGVDGDPFPADRPDHPGDRDPYRREVTALVADGLGFGAAVAGRMARFAHLPTELAGVVPMLQSQPRIRHRIESVLGRQAADVTLAVTNAVAAAFSQGPLGLVADAGHRALLLLEIDAAHRNWQTREARLRSWDRHDRSAERHVEAQGPGEPDRPVGGPAETYAERAGAATAAAGSAGLVTGRLRRASSLALAGTPKAARHGPEAFAATVHRALAERGLVCFDPGAVRRLDRIDSVVVDASVLRDGDGGGDGGNVGDGLAPGARELVEAAHRAGHMVAVAAHADEGPQLVERLGADLVVAGGDDLAASLRMLCDDDCRTLAIAAGHPEALRLADCGLGLLDGDGRPPWGAHLVATERGLEDAVLVVEAAAAAHQVSRQSAALSLAGSGVGALLGVTSPRRDAPGRAQATVNVSTLAAMANGVRSARAVAAAGRRLRLHDDGPPWHALDADDVLARLDTGSGGLDEDEADRRRAELPGDEDTSLSLGQAFGEELANPLTPALAVGGALSAAVGSPADAGIVGGVVAVNSLIGATQRVRVDRAVGELERSTSDGTTQVRRGGRVRPASADELVPGDVIVLESGDSVPADCRVLRADNLEVDESSLTGESLTVPKAAEPVPPDAPTADRHSMLYDGSAVAVGEAEAVVVAVGSATEAGRAATGEAVVSRGVEERLTELSRVTLPVAVAGGLIVTGAGLLRRQPLRQGLAPGVNLAVAAVPEGLPLLATVAQLSAAKRLSTRGALVRNPQAIETLGRVGVLCVDKTGTLTGGTIELRTVSDGVHELPHDELTPAAERIVAASVRASPEAPDGDGELPHLTDRAVLAGADVADVAVDQELHSWTRRAELPFEPSRGYHAVLGRNGSSSLLCVKGAPEVVLPRCDTWAHPDGKDRPLDTRTRRRLDRAVDQLAHRGHRVLAVAEREASSRRDLEDDRVARLRLLGFLGLIDPVRPEATEGVARLRDAGLRVVMVTGDHPSTAEGIAGELGLGSGASDSGRDGDRDRDRDRTVTGTELEAMSDDELDATLDGVTVFARVTPAHKVRIVEAYRRRGTIVAMTGDGANDAPAIRLADVGVALGENATPAARSAADLVVPDGRIETIVAAIVEGRAMWGSVRDALAILLGGNLGEIGFTVAGTVAGGRPPLNPRQIMLVNLMTDVAPGLAVAVRPPKGANPDTLLQEGPDTSLGSALDREIGVRAVTTAAGAGLAWTAARLTGRARRASTVGLLALVGTQLGQTLLGSGGDPLVVSAALGSAAALAGIVQTPGVSQFFGSTPIGPVGWGIAASASVGATAAGALAGRLTSFSPPKLGS